MVRVWPVQGLSPGAQNSKKRAVQKQQPQKRAKKSKGQLPIFECFDLSRVFLQGATMPPLHPIFFGIVILVGRGISFFFNLARVFLQDATMPPLNPFFGIVIIVGRGIMLLLRLTKVFLQVVTMPLLQHFFGIVIIVGRALCFCFDLAKLFRQVPPCHPYTKFYFSELPLLWERGIMLLLRLSQGISSGCHLATPKTVFFAIFIIVGRVIMLQLRLSQSVSSGCHYANSLPIF